MKILIIQSFIFLILISCKQRNIDNDQKIPDIADTTNNKIEASKTKFDTILNNSKYLILSTKAAEIKIVKEREVEKFTTFDVITGYHDGDVVLGKRVQFDDIKIYRKFHPVKTFEDFKVEIYSGNLAKPDFSSNPTYQKFKSRIQLGCNKGVNFAGHYTLITWGCGSPCEIGVAVDRKNGKIFDGLGSSTGIAFRVDSRLIIRNFNAIDSTTSLIRTCAYCDVTMAEWTGTALKEIE